jgi:hypothetical protein
MLQCFVALHKGVWGDDGAGEIHMMWSERGSGGRWEAGQSDRPGRRWVSGIAGADQHFSNLYPTKPANLSNGAALNDPSGFAGIVDGWGPLSAEQHVEREL